MVAIVSTTAGGVLGQDAEAPRREVTIPGTDIAFHLVRLPGGAFDQGTADATVGDDDERPLRTVELSPFWIGIHEVTHDEYEVFRFRGLDDHIGEPGIDFDADGVSRPTPPYEDPAHGLGKEGHPATGMTRRAALEYARWLSLKTGRLFRLPTEAEWEYACLAGASGAGTAWTDHQSSGAHQRVGETTPNGWGLFDMQGNVSEWVLDSYDDQAYAVLSDPQPAADPVAGNPPRGRGIVRGGGFDDPLLRCADRLPEQAAWKRRDPQIPKSPWWNTDSPHVGFRLVSPDEDLTLDQISNYWKDLLGAQ